MAKTKIEWAERTWNPITGCTKISAGCKNCYAERMSKRLAGRYGYDKDNPFKVTFHPNRLEEPLRWRKPQIVFVCSMGDLFHEDVPEDWINRVFAVMALCPQHTFLVLTKRPERMKKFIIKCVQGGVSKNVWLGVTVENQELANERIPILLQTPAEKRFVSVEPMLGPVYLDYWFDESDYCNGCGQTLLNKRSYCSHCGDPRLRFCRNGVDWVICGGETGHGARPMHPDWARGLRDQCVGAGVPFFFKQWGEFLPVLGWVMDEQIPNNKEYQWLRVDGAKMMKVGRKLAGRKLDGCEWNERPEV